MHDHDAAVVFELNRIANELRWIRIILQRIYRLELLEDQIYDFTLKQIGGSEMITGVLPGATGTFQIGFVPPNGVPLPSPPVVSVDDPKVTLGPVDTSTFQFTASVASDDTSASFNLTVSGTNAAGTAITHTFNVPVLAPPPPPQITDFTLDQVS
jgi:hypothetical protein